MSTSIIPRGLKTPQNQISLRRCLFLPTSPSLPSQILYIKSIIFTLQEKTKSQICFHTVFDSEYTGAHMFRGPSALLFLGGKSIPGGNYIPCGSSFSSNISIGTCSYSALSLMYYVAKNSPPRFVFITCNFLVFCSNFSVYVCVVCVCVCVCVRACSFNCHYSRGGLIILAVMVFAFICKGYTSAVAISSVSDREVQFLLGRK